MKEQTRNMFNIYKYIMKLNVCRFVGFTSYEIAAELQKFTGVQIEYGEEQKLIDAITKCRGII